MASIPFNFGMAIFPSVLLSVGVLGIGAWFIDKKHYSRAALIVWPTLLVALTIIYSLSDNEKVSDICTNLGFLAFVVGIVSFLIKKAFKPKTPKKPPPLP